MHGAYAKGFSLNLWSRSNYASNVVPTSSSALSTKEKGKSNAIQCMISIYDALICVLFDTEASYPLYTVTLYVN